MDEGEARSRFLAAISRQRNLGLCMLFAAAALVLVGSAGLANSDDEAWGFIFLMGLVLGWYAGVRLHRNGWVRLSPWDRATVVPYTVVSARFKGGGDEEDDWTILELVKSPAEDRTTPTLVIDVRTGLAALGGVRSWIGDEIIMGLTHGSARAKPRVLRRKRFYVVDRLLTPPDRERLDHA